jgi:prevent-host-death family protein
MKIEFKVLPMMELRSSPGEYLDRVARDGDVFIVERNGQQKACLVPISFLLPDISTDRISREIDLLKDKNEGAKLTINEKKEIDFSFHEIAAGDSVIVHLVLPHGYPATAPRIYVNPLPEGTPGLWEDGSVHGFGIIEAWNPKRHDILTALAVGRSWLKKFARWRKTGAWDSEAGPSGEMK